MANIIAFPLLVLLLASGTVYAQGHCLECYKAADEEVAVGEVLRQVLVQLHRHARDQQRLVAQDQPELEQVLVDNPKEVSPKNE